MLLDCPGGAFAQIALVHVGQGESLAGGLLHGPSQTPDLDTILGTGRGDVERQQVAQRVHFQVQLGATLALDATTTSPTRRFRD